MVLDSFQAGQSETGPVYDFATSTPLATQEETRQFVALADELAQQRPGALLRYPPTRGAPALTQALRQHLAARGIAAADEDILVVNGSQQGIDLICKALVGKNTAVLAEGPSYSVALHCFQRAGARVVTVPLLADGPDMDAIRAVVDQTPIDFYYTMTHFQCPSNVCWSERKRREMLALYLQRGLYAAHLERLVAQYASKRRCMSQAIRASKHLSLPYPEQAGGVFFWVQIPDAVDAVLLWKRLRLQGVKLMPGTVFSLTGSAQRFLRLSYVGCPLEMIPEGIHCIDREIDWLLQNEAAHVGDSFCDIALPQQ